MPLYEYVCDDCDTRFEALRQSAKMDEPAGCPRGHESSHRVLSSFSALTRDGYTEPEPVAGGGGCGGGCAHCACSVN